MTVTQLPTLDKFREYNQAFPKTKEILELKKQGKSSVPMYPRK